MGNAHRQMKGTVATIGTYVVVALVLLAAVAGRLWVTSDHARQLIQGRINEAIPGSIVWDDLSLSLFAGRIEVTGLRLDGPEGAPLVSLDRIFVNLSWAPLLRKTLALENVVLEKPEVRLATSPAGELNILKAFPAPSPNDTTPEAPPEKRPFNVRIDELSLTDGFFQYDHLSSSETPGRITVRTIGFTAEDGDLLKRTGRVSLRLTGGEIDMPGIVTGVDALRLDGHLEGDRLKSVALALESDFVALEGKGSADDLFDNPLFDMDITATAALTTLREAFQLTPVLSGPVTLQLTARGTADNPRARLTLSYSGGEIAGTQVHGAELACTLKEKELDLEKLSIDTPLGRVAATGDLDLNHAFPEGFTAETRDLDAMAWHVKLSQTGTDLATLSGNATGVTGVLQSDLTLDGTGMSPATLSAEALLSASVRGLALARVPDPMDLTLDTRLTMENNRLALRHLNAEAGEATLEGTGSLDLSTAEVKADLSLGVQDLASLRLVPEEAGLRGRLTLDIGVSGSTTHPVAEVRILGDDLGAGGHALGTLRLAAGLDRSGELTLHELTLEESDARIRAMGSINLLDSRSPSGSPALSPTLPVDLALEFENIDTATFLESAGVSGQLNGTFTCKGPLRNPAARLALTGSDLAVEDYRLGDLAAVLHLKGGVLKMDEVRMTNGQSEVALSGTARVLDADTGDPLAHPAFDAVLKGDSLYLEDVTPQMAGRLSINARLAGDTADLRGSVSLTARELDLGVQTIHEVTLDSRMENNRITVDDLVIALTPGEELKADGWISPTDKTYALRVKARDISIEDIELIGAHNAAQGRIDLDVSGEGTLDNPSLTGKIAITRLRLNNEAFNDGTLEVSLQDHEARVRGDLVTDLSGSYNLSTHMFSATARMEKTRLEPFFKMAGRTTLTGNVSGLIEARGDVTAPKTLTAEVAVTELTISHEETELIDKGACNASFDNGILHVETLNLSLFDQGHLDISGEGSPEGPLNFSVDGAVPLEVIHLFIEELGDITGDMTLSARLSGTLKEPDFNGELTLEQIGFTVPVLGQQLHSLNGRMTVTPRALTVDTLTGNLDKGRFDFSGTLGLDHVTPVSVKATLKAHALPLVLPDTMELLVNGELTYAGKPEHALISGEIVLVEGRYFKNVRLGLIDSFGQRRREAAPVTRRRSTPILDNTELNISIRHRSPFVVDNNIALMALKPTMTIYGPLSRVLVNGRAEVESGTISYLGKEFEIKKGVVDFINPYKVEATIDVDSEIKVRQWTITLKVSGVEDNLKFEMSSVPEETDTDIISLIVFNKTRSEMISGEGGSSMSTKQILADLVTRTLEGSLKEATGLDTIEMTYTERTDQEDAEDINITVGKELSKRMTLKYGVGTKNGVTVQSAITEYKFYENVLMNAFRDTDGDFGGELIFRLEMR
ncbi:translocation/assembly module TamB domain-containing protein [Desulfoluna spongiiphila]|uniref:translocation/assembly module TamB domain-containing protein n=1 Tax=Desulfoluna spongiiphila TaxID=419481 RepID=UPI001251D70A|nr:translocation/assembly module TamB domain-containing protein [Desulfoluna spongiiphila]VVS90958.1 translocation and assembly module tamb [Desulfoluna spongiiphila]